MERPIVSKGIQTELKKDQMDALEHQAILRVNVDKDCQTDRDLSMEYLADQGNQTVVHFDENGISQ